MIKPGTLIKGPQWPVPVEVKLIEEMGDFVRIVGVTRPGDQSPGEHIDQIIPREEWAHVTAAETTRLFAEDPAEVFLALETKRYRFASLYDPLLAMNTSKIDPLPHQIEAVYGYVLQLPRIRFLIADDPGAGKTIMAGLIIKEMKLRHLVRRILIVTPGHLKDQWRRELAERFEEHFLVVERGLLDAFYGENVWRREPQVITSLDFAKRDDVLPALAATHFDLIIVDEAHKMSAYRYGDKTERTGRYKLGESLSRITEHLLFLTATPHRGDPENFRLFLDLLEPGFFATKEMLDESIASRDNPLFIRRVKEDLKDFEGRPLFLPRHVKTLSFNLGADSPAEKELYNDLSRYVNTQYNKALTKDKRRNVAFALVILQRRLASSTYALFRSLERRRKRLTDLLRGAQEKGKPAEETFDFDAVEDLSEEERWKEEELWETLSVAENREDLEAEIATLDGLIAQAKQIIQDEGEIKLKDLKASLGQLSQRFSDPKDKKILIFTESRDTLEYLEKKIRDWGYRVNTIHGGMRLEDRIRAEGIFRNETEVLVATEAAGEGINLQFCHLMINYDIPWNPNRLEQRMGRIHRYGQQKEVSVFNLVAEDTREGKVLHKLFDKLEEIRQALGSDKVFDVLSEVLCDQSLSQLLMDAAANARNIDEILRDLDIRVDDAYIARVKENLGESLATRFIDYTRIREMAQRAREHRLIPEYTENWFRKAFVKAGGRLRERKDEFLGVEAVPYPIRQIAEETAFRKSHGEILKRYPRVTFDKEVAFRNPEIEFVSFGHPLFEALLNWCEREFADALMNGAVFTDPDGRLDGHILFYEGELRDGTGAVAGRRLFGFYAGPDEIRPVPPSVVWDLAEGGPREDQTADIEALKKAVANRAIGQLREYREELLRERQRQAAVKEKYGVRSLEYLIVKLDGELISLYDRKAQGENVDLPIFNKEERKATYEQALRELKDAVVQERSLTMSMPRFLGLIRVCPAAPKVGEDAVRTEEIERIGMAMAMKYEERQGRTPEDVCAENLGFDIRSGDPDGRIRYIEVKARAATGPVALTQNEWFKARRFQDDYFLYAVMNAATDPELYVIRNPAQNLKPDEKIEVVRYVVPLAELTGKGTKVVP
ncbi:MAG: helicase-related protein [Pseudomonadota bacterium]